LNRNSIFPKIQIALCFLGIITLMSAQAQEKLTLSQAIEIALENNYAIKIVRNQQRIAENNTTFGNAGLLPTITATAQTNNNYNALFRQEREVTQTIIDPVTGDTTFRTVNQVNEFNGRFNTSWNAGISINWSIFLGASLSLPYERLEELRQAGRENTEVTIENTIASVTNAYFDIIQQEQRRVVVEDALKISEERLRLARNRYEVGSGSRQEFLSAQVDYNTDQSALIAQEQLVASAKVVLNQLLTRPANADVTATDSMIVNPNLKLADLQTAVEQQNPSLLAAQRSKNIAYLATRIARAQRLPQLDVFTILTRNRQNSRAFIIPNTTNSLVTNFGAALSIPIFNGNNLNRQIQNARIEQQNTELQYQDLRNQLLADLQVAYVNYSNSLKLIALERQNVNVAQQNITIALERYKTGVTTSLEVRDVQRNAVAAGSRLIDAIFNAKLAETELLRLSSQIVQ